ncbi:DUF6182 family protein [Streptomyces sp. NPDC087300]|uniref:DUF6182 family protein n=1 Tax=Streptomyces sp. NPDC087300 TaxID=3365780 RepID=UPI003827F36B
MTSTATTAHTDTATALAEGAAHDGQAELRLALDARVRAAGPPRPPAPAVAVLRSFDPATFARSVLDFAARLPEETRRDWQADYTRTVYLVGNPANIRDRLPPATVSPDGQVAWYTCAPWARHRDLRLLLRTVQGRLPAGMPERFTVDVPAPPTTPARTEEAPRHWHLTVATAGLDLPRYLVHVGHTLAEPTLTGVLAPGDRITVRHTADIGRLPVHQAYVRVHQDLADTGRLRAYAVLAAAEEGDVPHG